MLRCNVCFFHNIEVNQSEPTNAAAGAVLKKRPGASAADTGNVGTFHPVKIISRFNALEYGLLSHMHHQTSSVSHAGNYAARPPACCHTALQSCSVPFL